MLRKSNNRRGTVAVLVTISLVAILGVLALALDGGLMMDNYRGVQSAADAAALAAADDLYNDYATNNGADTSGDAKTSALSTAAANGYNNDGVTNIVTVNIPPTSGNFSGKAGYAEVIIQFNQPRNFSGYFGSGNLPVTARAVARGVPGNIGILILDPHLQGACEIDGNVNVLNGGQIFSNSDNTVANDSASSYASGSIYVNTTGTISTGGMNYYKNMVNDGVVSYTNNGAAQSFGTRVVDPLATIPQPKTTGLTNHGSVTATADTTLQPGVYSDLIVGDGSSTPTVTLAAGIYYITSSVQLNSGSLKGTGVMFYYNSTSDNFLNGMGGAQGTVNISPPTATTGGSWPTGTTSDTYKGISLWVPRGITSEVHVKSAYNLSMIGTFYAEKGEYDIRPDGSSTVFDIGNYICGKAEWGQGYDSSNNQSNGTINMHTTTAAPNFRPALVE
jgi:hypothetical protein